MNVECPCCGTDDVQFEGDYYVCLGCGHEIELTPAQAKEITEELERDNRAWREEIAMEAGMLGGCDAYNEVMGY